MANHMAFPGFVFLIFVIRYRTSQASPFSIVAKIGFSEPGDIVPSESCALSQDERYLYLTGIVETGVKPIQFGKPLRNKLGGQTDLFLSKIDLTYKKPVWTVTEGSSKTDTVEALLLHDQDKFIFAAGSTYGNFAGAVPKGLSDVFINKYEVGGTKLPKPVWLKPMMLGSTGMESVTALSSEGNVIYAAGFTTGELFAKSKGGSDAILFTFDSDTGIVLRKTQFGTGTSEKAKAILIGPEAVTVVAEVKRNISNVIVTNLQLYKFSKTLMLLGDLLIETFAEETISRILLHPHIPDAVLLIGTSKLDNVDRESILLRRVQFDAFSAAKIGNMKLTHKDIKPPAFVARISGSKHTLQYNKLAGVHASGRVIVGGFTTGIFGSGAGSSIAEPYIASLDPRDGSKQYVLQKGGSKQDWFEVQAGVLTRSKVYWVGKASNRQSNRFYTYVGSFEIPSSWQENVSLENDFVSEKLEGRSQRNIQIYIGIGVSAVLLIGLVLGFYFYRRYEGRKDSNIGC